MVIKRAGGLVKEQNTREVNNRARDHDALALPPPENVLAPSLITVYMPIGIFLMSSSRPTLRAASHASSSVRFAAPTMLLKMSAGISSAPQTPPHHELPFAKVQSTFFLKQKTHAAVSSPKKSGGFEINGG